MDLAISLWSSLSEGFLDFRLRRARHKVMTTNHDARESFVGLGFGTNDDEHDNVATDNVIEGASSGESSFELANLNK